MELAVLGGVELEAQESQVLEGLEQGVEGQDLLQLVYEQLGEQLGALLGV